MATPLTLPARLDLLRQQLAWRAGRLPWRQHGVLLLCLAACLLMALRVLALRADVDAATSRLRYQQVANGNTSATPADAASRFLGFFPAQDPTEEFLRRAYAEAGRHGIHVTRVAVEATDSGSPELHQQALVMSLSAPDDAYREMVYTLLKRHPAISLSRLRASRDDRGAYQVELVWGVWFR